MIPIYIRKLLPNFLRARLWGDRERWGVTVQPDDACWKEWQVTYPRCYESTQRTGIGTVVNDAGYGVMSNLDFTGKRVLEIGAADIRHFHHWRNKPAEYVLVDNHEGMLSMAIESATQHGVPHTPVMLTRDERLPIEDDSVDAVITFYSLEHLNPLRPHLTDIHRVLKDGGVVIGAIPAEGGLAWGVGRYFTSRRWFKKNTTINPDKIICWEHPNFADDVIKQLDELFVRKRLRFWPLRIPLLDTNLIIQFIYEKRGE